MAMQLIILVCPIASAYNMVYELIISTLKYLDICMAMHVLNTTT